MVGGVVGTGHARIYYGLPGRSSKMPLRGDDAFDPKIVKLVIRRPSTIGKIN